MKPFYITTAIDYPNGSPHMGHAYEKVVSDFYARYYRQFKGDAYFLTGTDENGQKLIKSAASKSIDTMEFVNQNVVVFKNLCQSLNISNDDFIRTTEKRHFDFVQSSWKKLVGKELIYQGTYSGLYCYDCENFYNVSSVNPICPEHGTKLVEVQESGYFFKLSTFHDKIVSLIETKNNFIVPGSSLNELLTRLKSDKLKDIAISRPNEKWGIPVPGDEKYVVYTWFDALMNYTSGLSDEQMKKYWPASVHVIGKDIVWFHAVIWPAILMGLELPIPDQIYVHGMILDSNGRKMSKSLNNGIDPMEIMQKYPVDTFRYYLLSAMPASADGSFAEKDLINTHNTLLANDLGNLIMRVIKLALSRLSEPTMSGEGAIQEQNFEEIAQQYHRYVKQFEHNKAIWEIRNFVQATNLYMQEQAPWKHKDDADQTKFKSILYNCLFAIHCANHYLKPVMPEIGKKIDLILKPSTIDQDPTSLFGKIIYTLEVPEILFQKIEL